MIGIYAESASLEFIPKVGFHSSNQFRKISSATGKGNMHCIKWEHRCSFLPPRVGTRTAIEVQFAQNSRFQPTLRLKSSVSFSFDAAFFQVNNIYFAEFQQMKKNLVSFASERGMRNRSALDRLPAACQILSLSRQISDRETPEILMKFGSSGV